MIFDEKSSGKLLTNFLSSASPAMLMTSHPDTPLLLFSTLVPTRRQKRAGSISCQFQMSLKLFRFTSIDILSFLSPSPPSFFIFLSTLSTFFQTPFIMSASFSTHSLYTDEALHKYSFVTSCWLSRLLMTQSSEGTRSGVRGVELMRWCLESKERYEMRRKVCCWMYESMLQSSVWSTRAVCGVCVCVYVCVCVCMCVCVCVCNEINTNLWELWLLQTCARSSQN